MYPNGANVRPDTHERAGLEIARGIQPLNRDGKSNPQNGRIVLISLGMSNTTQAFSVFQQAAERESERNPKLVLVDGAQGGWSADRVVSNGQ